tara:strand:- start:2542 stop:2967 length:426 start_codon:yes stop_codon:yes gene_type:complete
MEDDDLVTIIAATIDKTKESPESKATIEGIDQDNDGIRDDVQAKIDQEYEDNAYIRDHSRIMARKYQDILSGSLSSAQVNQRITDIDYQDSCLNLNGGDPNAGIKFVLPNVLNTYQRSKVYIESIQTAAVTSGRPSYVACN